jgi:WD40 repeat protein
MEDHVPMLKKPLCALMLLFPASLWAASIGMAVLCDKVCAWIDAAAVTPSSRSYSGDLVRTSRALGAALFVAGLATSRRHDDTVISLSWSRDGKSMASMSDDGNVRLWDARTGREARTFSVDLERLHSVAWSPDGKLLAVSGLWEYDDSFDQLDLWDMVTGKKVRTLHGPSTIGKWTDVSSLAWSPDGKSLAFGSGDIVELFDPGTGQRIRTFLGHQQMVKNVAWSPDGKLLASASNDETIKLWDASSGRELRTFPAHAAESLTWGPDGKSLASIDNDKVQLLDIDSGTGNNIQTLDSRQGYVFRVTWKPDGKSLATAGSDHTVKLWDARSHKELRTLRGHTDDVTEVVWSPDGKSLASASRDQTVKVWDSASGKELRTLRFHTAP